MKTLNILKRENENSQYIWLYPQGKFYGGYNVSAYLFAQNFWPDIHPQYHKYQKLGEYIRIGFPIDKLEQHVLHVTTPKGIDVAYFQESELEPVVTSPTQKDVPLAPNEKDDGVPIVRIGPLPLSRDAYAIWRDNFIASKKRQIEELKPVYGGLPIYGRSYNLFNDVVSATRHLNKSLNTTLGTRMIDTIIDINVGFFQALNIQDKTIKKQHIEHILQQYNTLKFLFRLAHEQGDINLDRAVSIAEDIQRLESELHRWSNKL